MAFFFYRFSYWFKYNRSYSAETLVRVWRGKGGDIEFVFGISTKILRWILPRYREKAWILLRNSQSLLSCSSQRRHSTSRLGSELVCKEFNKLHWEKWQTLFAWTQGGLKFRIAATAQPALFPAPPMLRHSSFPSSEDQQPQITSALTTWREASTGLSLLFRENVLTSET